MDRSVFFVQISGNQTLLTNQHRFYHYFSFYKLFSILISQCLPKSKFPACANFFSLYEEIPENFLDEKDVDSIFYHNILDILQSHHRIVPVSKGSNKKSFAFNLFHFCDSKLQQRFILKEEFSSCKKKKLSLYSTVWVNFSKLLIKPTKFQRFHYPNLSLRLDLQKQKTNFSLIVTKI